MSLYIPKWSIIVVLALIPVVYNLTRKSQGSYDFNLDGVGCLVLCWALAIGIGIGWVTR